MDYSFNVQLAEQYGVEEAVLLNHLYFWIQKNAANDKHFHNKRYWTYNSAQAFTVIFPFWSRKKIDRLIQSLRDQGAVVIGNFNDDARDRTRWFALPENVLCIVENRPTSWTKSSNECTESVQPLPDSKPDINTDINHISAQFELFWKSYPRKSAKEAARKAFEKLMKSKTAPTIERLIDSIKAHAGTPEWEKQDGQFIPYPATYLNGGMYEDEIKRTGSAAPRRTLEVDAKGNLI
ncbi:MAG: hypothetical protein ABFC31_07145 [Clostridiaceae bacterium]